MKDLGKQIHMTQLSFVHFIKTNQPGQPDHGRWWPIEIKAVMVEQSRWWGGDQAKAEFRPLLMPRKWTRQCSSVIKQQNLLNSKQSRDWNND